MIGVRVQGQGCLPRVLCVPLTLTPVFRLALSSVHRAPLISSLPPFTYNHASLSSVSRLPPSFCPHNSFQSALLLSQS